MADNIIWKLFTSIPKDGRLAYTLSLASLFLTGLSLAFLLDFSRFFEQLEIMKIVLFSFALAFPLYLIALLISRVYPVVTNVSHKEEKKYPFYIHLSLLNLSAFYPALFIYSIFREGGLPLVNNYLPNPASVFTGYIMLVIFYIVILALLIHILRRFNKRGKEVYRLKSK